MIKNILPQGIDCVFVRQPEQLGLGHAILCAEKIIGDEPFAVLLADDFLTNGGEQTVSKLIKSFEESQKIKLSVMEVNGPEISEYGVVSFDKNGNVAGLVEKPSFRDAPSRLASIGRYILTPNIFESIKNVESGFNRETNWLMRLTYWQ